MNVANAIQRYTQNRIKVVSYIYQIALKNSRTRVLLLWKYDIIK